MFDHESKVLNLTHYYNSHLSDQIGQKEILMTQYTSLSYTPAFNYVGIYYYPHTQKILFFTQLKYSAPLHNEPSVKYLGVEDGELTLVNYAFIFEVQQVERGKDLLENQPFFIKIPNLDLYLRSIPSECEGVNKIKVKNFDEKNQNQFYFYFTEMQMNNAELFVRRIDNNVQEAYSVLKKIDTQSIGNLKEDQLIEDYDQVKECLSYSLHLLNDREPNRWKDADLQIM